MGSGHHSQLVVKKFEPSQRLKTLAMVLVGIGLLGFVVGLVQNPERLWTSYLTGFFFVTAIAMGAMFFVAIQSVAKAGWSSSIRRIAEGITSFIPVILVGGLVLLFGVKKLYVWTDANLLETNHLVHSKAGYLNVPFLVVRLMIFSLGTWFFWKKIVGNSIKQDADGDHKYTISNTAWGVAYVLFFALSFTFFSFDLLMSLLPTWYSTIFGVYCFAGAFQSSLAFLILVLMYLKSRGFVQGYYNEEHIHDVAKFLKGFTVFWAYIAFSQFMLIWYANIPEETEYYLLRAHGGWMAISMALLVFKFVVPFLVLLPRGNKRNPQVLVAVCALILVMQYIDVYWMVYPTFFDNHVTFGVYEVALACLFLGVMLLRMIKFYQSNNLVAIKDPRIHEALNHHVTY
jgi:hypothetical protein